MFTTARYKANAKINLCLDIIAKRADGYHLLESIMQSIELCDRVSVTRRKHGILVECSSLDIEPEKNIAYKAAKAFFEHTKINGGAKIKIKKYIPSQAGLGGGSADAAAVLTALNKLYKTKLDDEMLCSIGEKVGADVPFCICGGTRLVRGIGEILTKLEDLPYCSIVIVKGNEGVCTKQAYDDFDNASDYTKLRIEKVIEAISAGDFEAMQGRLINVFEQTTSVKEISRTVKKLKNLGAVEAAMTGSGSAVFGIFTSRKKAKICVRALKKEYPFVTVTHPSVNGIKKICVF